MTNLTLAPLLTRDAARVRNALAGIEVLVPIRPETSALIEQGTRVQSLVDSIRTDMEIAEIIQIDSPDTLIEAQQIAGRIASVRAAADQERKAITAPFFDFKRMLDAGYNELIEHLAETQGALNRRVVAYADAQQRITREREAAAAREREAAAAAARKQQEEAEAAARKLVDEANAAAQAGQPEVAQAKATEAALTADAGRQAAQDALHESFARTGAAPAAPKGMRENWTAPVTDFAALVLHVADRLRAGDRSLLNLLEANQSALNAKAKLEKEGFNVPGVRADMGRSVSTRKVAVAA